MAIIPTQHALLIRHKIVGREPIMNNIGKMTLETAIMLDAHHLSQTIAGHVRALKNIQADRTNYNWLIRAYHAAMKAKPQIATAFGEITPHAESMLSAVNRIITILSAHDDRYLHPDSYAHHEDWDIDDCLLEADIPYRALRLLRGIHNYIQSNPDILKMNGKTTEDWNEALSIYRQQQEPKDEPLSNTTNSENSNSNSNSSSLEATIGSPLAFGANRDTTQQLLAITIKSRDLFNDELKEITVVPTVIFGTAAKADTNTLIRYGLLEGRVIRTGQRGRPRHAVVMSPIGAKLADHQILKSI